MLIGMGSRTHPHPDSEFLTRALPWWSHRSICAAWLRGFRRRVARDAESLAHLLHDEIGKPIDEAIAADVMALLAAIKWHEKHAARILSPRRAKGRPAWLLGVRHRVMHAPLGRVGIIATWNYPVQLLGVQLVQALVAGNRVIVKPSEHAPRTQHALLELAREGLPEGTLEWTDATREAGRDVLREGVGAGTLDHIVFTGSTSVGRAIASTLADPLVPSTLDLSGRDSAFVMSDANPALAARTIWHHVTMNAGQTCMAPRRALVHQDIYAEFIRQLGLIGAGEPPRRLITREAAQEAHRAAVEGVEAGGRPLSGVLEEPGSDCGRLMHPVALVDCPANAPTVAGNHFGPVIAVVPVRDLDEALAIHHEHGQHLATSVFTRSKAQARTLAPRLGSSVVTINDVILPTAHPATALGGRGPSGWGLSRGEEGLRAMTRTVAVSHTGTIRLPVGPTPPGMTDKLSKLIGTLYGKVAPTQSTPKQSPTHPSRAPERSRDPQEVSKP